MSQQYKVLVVDDDLKLRSLLERYLTEQGVCPGDTLDSCQATAARAGWRRKAPGVSTIWGRAAGCHPGKNDACHTRWVGMLGLSWSRQPIWQPGPALADLG